MHNKLIVCLLALGLASIIVSTSTAEEKAALGVTKIVFNNGGQALDGKIPDELQPVVDAIAQVHKGATFGVSESILQVKLNIANTPDGEVAKITHSSDCPVNSVFNVTDAVVVGEALRPTLVAFTQMRHAHLGLANAGVARYSYTEGSGRAEVVLTNGAE